MAAEWKKVIVSGSRAELLQLNVGANQQISSSAADTFLSGSFSGSFAGDGAGLTNIPYSSLTGAPEGGGSGNLIFSGSLTASFTSENGTPVDFKIVSGSTPTTLLTVQSSGITLPGEAFAVGKVTGSRPFLSGLTATPAGTFTVTAMTPTQIKSWQDAEDGSVWDSSILPTLINENTPISDILYFLLRPYAALYQLAGPNTFTFASVAEGTAPTVPTATLTTTARVPDGTNPNATIESLKVDGWNPAGSVLWSNIPPNHVQGVNNLFGTSVYYRVTSNRSTAGTNATNANAFGLGTTSSLAVNTANPFYVSASINYKYVNGGSTLPNTFTATTQSFLKKTTLGPSADANGLFLNLVNASFGPKYQEAYFQNVTFGNSIKFWTGSQASTMNAVGNLGYYELTASIFITSESISGGSNIGPGILQSGTSTPNFIRKKHFYVPTIVSSINPATHETLTTSKTFDLVAGSIYSSSLSGAPYLVSASYVYSESVSNIFNPLYSANTDIHSGFSSANLSIANGSGQTAHYVAVGSLPGAVNINSSGQINTANRVFDLAGTTVRSTSTIPYFDDTVKSNFITKFDATLGTNQSNVVETTTITSPTLTVNVANATSPAGTNAIGSAITRVIQQSGDVAAGPFGTLFLAWRKLRQTDAHRSSTVLTVNAGNFIGTESFYCETQRLVVNDTLLNLSTGPTSWPTAFGTNGLSAGDLQVKPGFLIKPASNSYGYWISDPGNNNGYYYYATRFSVAGLTPGARGSITLTFGNTNAIGTWNNTTTNNSIGIALMCESSDRQTQANATWVDLFNQDSGAGGFIANSTLGIINAGTAGLNPFSENIKMFVNGNGSVSGNTVTLPLASPFSINANVATQEQFVVLIRYKGDPKPISNIQVSIA